MSFDRKAGFSIEIKDPDSDGDIGETLFVNLGDRLLVVSRQAIFEMITADKIDPKNASPDTRHSYQKIASKGWSRDCVGHTLLVAKDLVSFSPEKADKHGKIMSVSWEICKRLIENEQIMEKVINESTELLSQCDKIVEENKLNGFIPSLPQVKDLELLMDRFLINGKKILISCLELCRYILGGDFELRIEKAISWVEKEYSKDSNLFKMLSGDLPFFKFLLSLRNAREHPAKGRMLEFYNFQMMPNNKFGGPAYTYDLTADGGKIIVEKHGLLADFNGLHNEMIDFVRDVISVSVSVTLEKYGLHIVRYPESNNAIPTKYQRLFGVERVENHT